MQEHSTLANLQRVERDVDRRMEYHGAEYDRQFRKQERKYGPPQVHGRGRGYCLMLELLESQANRKLIEEYELDIKRALATLEGKTRVVPGMIDLQPEIQWFMRPFLLDFLIELHTSLKLQPQTLFLCLNIIDRYCAKRIVFKRHYQLVGCTALWIAGKYEDKKSRVPTLRELSMMCRNAYDEEMFIQMEMHILATLEWSLCHPNLEDCLQLAISTSNISSHVTPCKYNPTINDKSSSINNASKISAVTAVGRFLCELSLYDKFFLSVPPSLVSITANLLACSMLQIPNASVSLHELGKRYLTRNLDQLDKIYSEIDENQENKEPEVNQAFLSGFDEHSFDNIRKIALMFIIQLSKVTEVLTKKYEELGVVQVVSNFNNRFALAISTIYENSALIIEKSASDLESSRLSSIADLLLQIEQSDLERHTEPPVPLTPPSATSQYSIFSSTRLISVSATPIQTSVYSKRADSRDDFSPMQDSENWTSPISVNKMHV
ncbi:uncharacterized protein PRCAT00006006001 [Priceomyces carsonii]|uniref:uncharacterized protein n=1 Tax=Priceomyces carsonii TaxID=28549 RepID=UPI002ED8DB69|nr:unnamed protein product [Priceomyces carsonii]